MCSPCTRLPDSLVKTLLSPYYSPPTEATETSQDSSCLPTPPHMFNVMTHSPTRLQSMEEVLPAHPNNSLSNEVGLLTYTAQTKPVSFALCSPSSPSRNDPPLFKPSLQWPWVFTPSRNNFLTAPVHVDAFSFRISIITPPSSAKTYFLTVSCMFIWYPREAVAPRRQRLSSHVFNINDSV